MKFSANLGFLWTELPLPDAIHAARAAGFDAVECHYPYEVPAADVAAALADTNLSMVSLNTRPGNAVAGEVGLSALPGREDEARAAIDEALDYAQSTGTGAVHVLAGVVKGAAAQAAYTENLIYACDKALASGLTILIEPLNPYDVPGYFLQATRQAKTILRDVNRPNLRLLFDCYHVQLVEGDLCNKLRALMPLIGHIQFAGVPDRGPPDLGEVNFAHVFAQIAQLGFDGPIGAEYRPDGSTDESLGWLTAAKRA